jgi:hypothetical protein
VLDPGADGLASLLITQRNSGWPTITIVPPAAAGQLIAGLECRDAATPWGRAGLRVHRRTLVPLTGHDQQQPRVDQVRGAQPGLVTGGRRRAWPSPARFPLRG